VSDNIDGSIALELLLALAVIAKRRAKRKSAKRQEPIAIRRAENRVCTVGIAYDALASGRIGQFARWQGQARMIKARRSSIK
jgi:hypothetical protein